MNNGITRYLKGYEDYDMETKALVEEVYEEVKKSTNFKYIYKEYFDILPFLQNDIYNEYLKGSTSYLLVACSLGIEIDQKIKLYFKKDQVRAVIFDAISSAYIEELADEYENKMPYLKKGFRFCPGYSETSLADNGKIIDLLQANKIGISCLASNMLVPQKSMVGIIAIGNERNRSCQNCIVKNCRYKEEGSLCYEKE